MYQSHNCTYNIYLFVSIRARDSNYLKPASVVCQSRRKKRAQVRSKGDKYIIAELSEVGRATSLRPSTSVRGVAPYARRTLPVSLHRVLRLYSHRIIPPNAIHNAHRVRSTPAVSRGKSRFDQGSVRDYSRPYFRERPCLTLSENPRTTSYGRCVPTIDARSMLFTRASDARGVAFR